MTQVRDVTAQRIRERRIEIGMTQLELAIQSGYSGRSSINKIEKDARNVPLDRLTKIAEALRVSPDYLMGWDDEADAFDEDLDRQNRIALVEKAFNLLNPEHQKAVLDLIQSLAAAEKR